MGYWWNVHRNPLGCSVMGYFTSAYFSRRESNMTQCEWCVLLWVADNRLAHQTVINRAFAATIRILQPTLRNWWLDLGDWDRPLARPLLLYIDMSSLTWRNSYFYNTLLLEPPREWAWGPLILNRRLVCLANGGCHWTPHQKAIAASALSIIPTTAWPI